MSTSVEVTAARTTIRQRLAVVVSVAGAMLVALDGTVLMVAQPELGRDLGATVAQVQWTSTGYLLAVAALLVVAGRLGDRYGHRLLLATGVLGFAATSAGIAYAPGIGWVVALRVLQGVFGALLQPATLALLRLAVPPDRLGGAVALRTSAIGIAAAGGPLLGGVLVAHLGWRAVFVLSVPVALVLAALTLAVRVPAAGRTGERPRLAGAVLLAGALAALVHTLVGVPAHGWTAPSALAGFVATALLGAAFVRYERRTAEPVIPAAVARSVPVMASMALLLVVSAGLFGALFVTTFLLQDVRGLGPFDAGVRVLPLTAAMVLGAPPAQKALRRYGARRAALTGTLCAATAIGALAVLGAYAAPVVQGMAFALLGAGFTTVMVTATGTVVGDAPPGYAGAVGGLKQTAMNVGPVLGIALAATVLHTDHSGPPHTPAFATLAALTALGLLAARLLPGDGAR